MAAPTARELVAKMDLVNVPLLEQDIKRFMIGRARIQTVKRWVDTRDDEVQKEIMADFICALIRNYLLGQTEDMG